MGGLFDKLRNTPGIEIYNRAFIQGVNLNKFNDAATLFERAANKFTETNDQANAVKASANSLLYRYLATGDPNILGPLIQRLNGLPEIEAIGSQTETIETAALSAELECRLIEADIAQAQNNQERLVDLHNRAQVKFLALRNKPLLTYDPKYNRAAPDGHNDNALMRALYHSGMNQYYGAMIEKYRDPEKGAELLTQARQAFQRCNDQNWTPQIDKLLDAWRKSRTCWICHREMRGQDLHYTLCRAGVTFYTRRVLETLKQDISTITDEPGKIAVCNTCASMITNKAADEADKVRQELTNKLIAVAEIVDKLTDRVGYLERRSHTH